MTIVQHLADISAATDAADLGRRCDAAFAAGADPDAVQIHAAAVLGRIEAESRQAQQAQRIGLAEMASSALHNVANVLTSVGVLGDGLARRATASRATQLVQVTTLLAEARDPAAFLRDDARGRLLPRLLHDLANAINEERRLDVADGAVLAKHLDHVRTIIATQQRYAVGRMHAERVALASLIDDAIAINLAGIERHGISLERDYAAAPMWHGEPHRLLQILINLIANAKVAVSGQGNKKTIRITARLDSDGIRIQVADNGQGMDAATMARLFSFGFTTRPDGHGFGLHSCQQHATALGGTLTAASDGPGCGAAFTLHLPTTT